MVEENTVRAAGFYPLEMNVEFLTPVERIVLEKGNTTPLFPTGEETSMLLYVRRGFGSKRSEGSDHGSGMEGMMGKGGIG